MDLAAKRICGDKAIFNFLDLLHHPPPPPHSPAMLIRSSASGEKALGSELTQSSFLVERSGIGSGASFNWITI
ncbi:hypothetical protein HA466_0012390 [Hirschfeldia incana]|nr:hypothetical protein HA466_0012390 [Hirschfeldia incana]